MSYEETGKRGIVKWIVILLVIIVAIIAGVFILSSRKKSDDEKLILYCSRKTSSNNIVFNGEIFLYKKSNGLLLKQKMISELNNKKLIYDENEIISYMKTKVKNGIKNALLDVEDYYDIDVQIDDSKIITFISYNIDSDKEYEFAKVFDYNFLDSSIDDIVLYMEMGGLSCQKK